MIKVYKSKKQTLIQQYEGYPEHVLRDMLFKDEYNKSWHEAEAYSLGARIRAMQLVLEGRRLGLIAPRGPESCA